MAATNFEPFQPFDVEKKHFTGLLLGGQFEVPDLQRPFAWREPEASDLIADVLGLVDELKRRGDNAPLPQHFIGSIVTITSDGQHSRVIDGQQRLTTVTLLLGLTAAAMKDIASKIKKSKVPEERKHQLEMRLNGKYIEAQNMLQFTDFDGESKPRFRPSPEIAETYKSFINGGDGKIEAETKEPALKLRSIAKLLNSEIVKNHTRFMNVEDIHQIEHLERVYTAISKCLVFVWVNTGTASAGYQLFESLNATGKPLNALDLLKVWMLNKLEGTPAAASVAKDMRDLTTISEDDDSKFLIDYYRARHFSNAGKKHTNKSLSLLVRGHVFRDPDVSEDFRMADASSVDLDVRIAKHVSTMSDWRGNWAKILKGELPYQGTKPPFDAERFKGLVKDDLKHVLPVPLFMQASAHLSLDEFAKLVHLIERVFFRYKTICNASVGTLENAYQDAARAIDSNGSLDLNLFAGKLQDLLDEHAPNNVFEANLDLKLDYSKGGANRIKYFLSMLDLYKANPAPARIALKGLNFSIEHIDPQRPTHPNQISPEFLHTIGNLCLLTPPENIKAGNKKFTEKKALLNNGSDCTAKLTQQVFQQNQWTDAEVKARRDALYESAKQIFVAKVV
jgi:Protein of unknown function DUF262/Protein of unknown function (DUF1524)